MDSQDPTQPLMEKSPLIYGGDIFKTSPKIVITVSQLKLNVPGRRARPDSNKVVMLDSKLVDAKDPGWVSLDVTEAVVRWHKHTHKPMALMLQVEDDKRKSLLPNSYIQPLNCKAGERVRGWAGGKIFDENIADPHTDSLTSHPAPLINGQNLFASLNKNNQPLIDVSTVEVVVGSYPCSVNIEIFRLQSVRMFLRASGASQRTPLELFRTRRSIIVPLM